jgi:uncharacterized protein YkwD
MASRLAALCVVAAALVPPGAALAAPERRSPERSMVDAVNDVRRAHGLRPLRSAPALARSADAFASRLMKLDLFAHAKRIVCGGRFRTLGELLAVHRGWRPRARGTLRRWLRSPSHRPLVLSNRFRYAGAGLSRGLFPGRLATIWVLRLGNR